MTRIVRRVPDEVDRCTGLLGGAFDEIAIAQRAERAKRRQHADALDEVGLPLTIFADDEVEARVRSDAHRSKIAEMFDLQRIDDQGSLLLMRSGRSDAHRHDDEERLFAILALELAHDGSAERVDHLNAHAVSVDDTENIGQVAVVESGFD